jgi:hypothetical protein
VVRTVFKGLSLNLRVFRVLLHSYAYLEEVEKWKYWEMLIPIFFTFNYQNL